MEVYIPDKAFDIALEGGYPRVPLQDRKNWQKHALSPLFFQSLGKALRWPEDWYMGRTELRDDVEGKLWKRGCPSYNAHEFYDLILDNGDTELFWNDLLT